MKKLTLLFAFFTVLLNVTAQTETKNRLVDDTYHQWKWNEDGCFNKWSVTFENKTKQSITSITFRLVIKEKESGVVRYKKTHTVNYSLNAYETAPSPYFNLTQELCGLKNRNTLEGYYYYTEVLSFK
ncbi:hypothetical protein GCM10022389_15830 [Flavobacterium cheonanense]|uniref:Uncharacterized protein n=1 Tax=Flavobacterium cheonanense TaxID=706183 RepID=A0ABP7VP03_9FLAO